MFIPKSTSDVVFLGVLTSIAAGGVVLGVTNLFMGVALVPSMLWLVFIGFVVASEAKQHRGVGGVFVHLVGELFGRQFVDAPLIEGTPREIRFGFELFGRAFITRVELLDDIKKVGWSTGQATGITGRDMDDWSVFVWFNPKAPSSIEIGIKSGADFWTVIHAVGPARERSKTEALGLEFLKFLEEAGVKLVAAPSNSFVRARESA